MWWKKIEELVLEDRQLTINFILTNVNISTRSDCNILHEILHKSKEAQDKFLDMGWKQDILYLHHRYEEIFS